MAGPVSAAIAVTTLRSAARNTPPVPVAPRTPMVVASSQTPGSCIAGIAWRSTWEVEHEISEGRLAEVLAEFAAPPNGIYAVFPQRKHLPLRVRLWIDFLKHHYAQPQFWRGSPS